MLSLGVSLELQVVAWLPDSTGEKFNAQDLAIGLTVARNLTDRLALGATVKNINRDILGEYKIRIPPLEVQKELLEKIEPKEC